MKRLIVAVAALLAVAVLGFGGLRATTTEANPTAIYVINTHVGASLAGITPSAFNADMITASGRSALSADFAAMQTASAGQISSAMTSAGDDWIVVQTNDATQPIVLNGRGLTCMQATTSTVSTITAISVAATPVITTAAAHNLVVGDQITISGSDSTPSIDGTYTVATVPTTTTLTVTGAPAVTTAGTTGTITPVASGSALCDNTATQTPDATDQMAVYHVLGAGTFAGGTVTATQTSISVDSEALTLVSPANNVTLTASKDTVQEGATACALAASQSSPSNGAATVSYTDINGNALVGYSPTFTTSSTGTMVVGNTAGTLAGGGSQQVTTMMQSDGTTIAGVDSYCGVAAGTATLSASTVAGEISGVSTAVTRTQSITVGGVPAGIALTAFPTTIACDGTQTSTVTATVTDSAGNNVVDGTNVNFSVVALGTANPINTTTTSGTATSVITPISAQVAGVTVTVTSGSVAQSILIGCTPATPAAPAAPAATAAPPTGTITGPNTGTGGYLGQSSASGVPMWTILALVLGSMALVGGGMVTRRIGK